MADQEDVSENYSDWQQGDYALDCGPLILRGSLDPEDADDEGVIYDDRVEGFVVISQTCDVVREPTVVPMVSVCPLVRVPEDRIRDIKKGIAPRLAVIADTPISVAVDLSRTMSVDKALLSTWTRQRGCRTEEEQRAFAVRLERVFGRFAFPDEFIDSIKAFRQIVVRKHGKENAPLGKILKSIREFRVFPDPDWYSKDEVLVSFIIILEPSNPREAREEPDREKIRTEIVKIIDKITWTAPFRLSAEGVEVVTLGDITAEYYLASYGLEVNDLSGA